MWVWKPRDELLSPLPTRPHLRQKPQLPHPQPETSR